MEIAKQKINDHEIGMIISWAIFSVAGSRYQKRLLLLIFLSFFCVCVCQFPAYRLTKSKKMLRIRKQENVVLKLYPFQYVP